MIRDIGTMDTPPRGTPIYPDTEITPVATPAGLLPKAEPQVPRALHDIYTLGKWFAKPRDWPVGDLAYYFRPGPQNYLSLAGGMEFNNLFMVPFRHVVASGRAHLHEFHGIVGRLGACFKFPDNARYFSKNFDAWHDVVLKSFFVEMLKTSNPTAGETLTRLWKHNMNNFTKATSQLRSISTLPQADDYTRAAALRVYGYTAPFFAQCHNTYRQGAMDHLDFFQTHQNPIVATAAIFSMHALNGIVR